MCVIFADTHTDPIAVAAHTLVPRTKPKFLLLGMLSLDPEVTLVERDNNSAVAEISNLEQDLFSFKGFNISSQYNAVGELAHYPFQSCIKVVKEDVEEN
ncbi:hypothetical protein HGM15179_000998 [Zosterops borbonicus]|uniref:Uncharacterized protein n=1 Tax=Zosterops borbonicus TaxID=364589 RepID=A0A8K1LUI7_9PASS|nr:hypothetical protein HGM15179_000998 [Zosterops borbonicus]